MVSACGRHGDLGPLLAVTACCAEKHKSENSIGLFCVYRLFIVFYGTFILTIAAHVHGRLRNVKKTRMKTQNRQPASLPRAVRVRPHSAQSCSSEKARE